MLHVRLIFAALCVTLVLAPQYSLGNEADIYRNNKAHVVQIAFAAAGSGTEIGTGVIISPAGHVLTAAHVVGRKKDRDAQSGTITITMLNESGTPFTYAGQVRIEKVDTNLDLAILNLSGDIFRYSEIALKDLAGMPPITAILWNASMSIPQVLSGRLNAPDLVNGGKWTLQMQALPSDSGSPVFDPDGKVVAILTNQFSDSDKRYAIATPLHIAEDFLPTMTEPERQRCIKQEREIRLRPKPVQDAKRVDCDSKKPTDTIEIELQIPPGHVLAGMVTHEDDTDTRYGRVEAVEYVRSTPDGPITTARIRLHCTKVNLDAVEVGWAKTTIRGNVRAIVTDDDELDIRRRCSTRRRP